MSDQNGSEHSGDRNFMNSINVFTENGTLSPLQMCELFKFFQKMPQYETSCFHQQCRDFYAFNHSKSTDQILDEYDEELDWSADPKH